MSAPPVPPTTSRPGRSAGSLERSSTSSRIGRLHRYAQLGLIVSRSGLVRGWRGRQRQAVGADDALGRSLRTALERAGGIYVKLGQFLSTRPDLVSPEVATELQLLQQEVPPMPPAQVEAVMTEELLSRRTLGVAVGDVLAGFDRRPVAAASVAQVHRARLADGRAVAVKVQRPDVTDRVRRDLDILARVAAQLERRVRWAADQQLVAAVDGFAASLAEELDFDAEADNLADIRRAVAGHERVVVPTAYRALTSRRVLVMEWIEGRPLTESANQELDPDDRHDLARSLLRCFLDQIFVVGVFHADPHPGNLHLTPDGRIALLDAGAVGRLQPQQRLGLQALLLAIATHDPEALADALVGISTVRPGVDRAGLTRALGRVLDRHLGPGARPDLSMFVDFTHALRDYGVAPAPVVLGAVRSLATVHTTIERLAPDLDLIAEAKAYGGQVLAAA